ncbi:hypothetical protein DDE01_14050 [Desulfovibrio desulfuricans]|nr:hypothetical protein DDE01_14050 [Desulfovibrio desulfuricans]
MEDNALHVARGWQCLRGACNGREGMRRLLNDWQAPQTRTTHGMTVSCGRAPAAMPQLPRKAVQSVSTVSSWL